MEARGDWLAKCLGNSVASPLEPADVEAVLAVATAEEVEAGGVLFGRDEPNEDAFILERGTVALSRPAGERSPLLQIVHRGEVFGDVALFLGRPAPVDAVALEDSTVLRIAGPDLVRLVTTRPRIALRWMVSMAQRLADSQDRMEELLAGPLEVRLAALLGHASGPDGTVPVSQETLARLLGVRRPSVARSLAGLERQGLVEKAYRRVRIVDADRLAALVR